MLYLLIAAGLIGIMVEAASLKNWNEVLTPFVEILGGEHKWAVYAGLALYGLALVMAWFVFQTAFNYVRGWGWWKRGTSRSRQTIEKWAERAWLVATLALMFLFGLAGKFALKEAETTISEIVSKFSSQEILLLLAVVVVYPLVRYFTVAFIGDVAVYVNADAKAESYDARRKILEDSCDALKRLLKDGSYERVLLAGHSLGSVIAYDTVNRLLTEIPDARNLAPSGHTGLNVTEIDRLQGLLTFGSPLDKIHYFFRKHVTARQPIRAQILSWLHYFRKQRSHRDYREYTSTPLSFDQRFGQLTWMNAWSPADPVSAKLHFYDVDEQRWFMYIVPVLAHTAYWDDQRFYSWWCGKLL